ERVAGGRDQDRSPVPFGPGGQRRRLTLEHERRLDLLEVGIVVLALTQLRAHRVWLREPVVDLLQAQKAERARSVDRSALDHALAELVEAEAHLVRQLDGVGLRALPAWQEDRRGAQSRQELAMRLRVAFHHRGDLAGDLVALDR